MNIADSIRRELEMQLSRKEVERVFEDGKVHEVTYVNALFLDGRSLNGEGHAPLIVSFECRSLKDFDERLEDFTKKVGKIYADVDEEDRVVLKATAIAGMVFVAETMKGQSGANMDRIQKAAQILGTAMSAAEFGEIDRALNCPEEIRKLMKDYAAQTEPPIGTDVVGLFKTAKEGGNS